MAVTGVVIYKKVAEPEPLPSIIRTRPPGQGKPKALPAAKGEEMKAKVKREGSRVWIDGVPDGKVGWGWDMLLRGMEILLKHRGEETSLNELALTLLGVMGSDLKPEYGPEREVSPIRRRLADTRKARELLGFEAQVSLEDGLRQLVNWWRAAKKDG